MKATEIVRNLDHLGRIVVPKEIRRTLQLSEGDPMEIFVDEEGIFIRKYDITGDVMQLLNKMERDIRMKETMISHTQLRELLEKVTEMKNILGGGTKR